MQAFFAHEYPQNEEVFVTTFFRGDVKSSVPGSWLILATCGIPVSLLATFGKMVVKLFPLIAVVEQEQLLILNIQQRLFHQILNFTGYQQAEK